jgi:hypothetical protein
METLRNGQLAARRAEGNTIAVTAAIALRSIHVRD